ncbi:arginine N-succinyltransferase [Pseudoalteromonas luteoviolacea]|uniref:Arginine N-succinyltransferase n=1 Tax=Pseudoalteromonas luteoviolacea DSM 6061 TaxID=1365250 RepID=A0A166X108_9GAMM|nr:arginine N-succinyltransferase [Pseudoalteromonas luteoviolacea]KZN39121.1 arginine N-succinyltransferase [Pseudoalteromonas luteoviolacea DSM 6061]KZN56983.1 arginine N-succinyltransferase [Pseudoalteromonas luteoviolacea CPMOR-2]MBE0390015.1 arginine N-succinyltransferase [Pseudoalteromonas luteoviolacea DSM 6061]TQF67441.1 arginine N-succinyltransferase [Pseudoalteromonas luteoviolacea]
MQVLRPISSEDFAALKTIAVESGHGFTSLPVDDELLSNKIQRSQESFAKSLSTPIDEGYLFVLEDTQTGDILGTTAIEAAVGMQVPLYHYHQGKTVHHSSTLNVYNTVEILSICNDYTGSSEICTLFLREQFRRGLAGRFLSRVRFLFMAQHSERFSDKVIAEMRGVSDENGHSPFWQWLQEHFFSIEFPQADHLVGLGDKVFISELMPKYPIYSNLLSPEAQAVIGHVHEKTKPALRLLQKEGFEHRGYVDLFDAGPTVEARLENIQTVRETKTGTLTIGDKIPSSADTWALSNGQLTEFRATFTTKVMWDEASQTFTVDHETAQALKLSAGDKLSGFVL